MNTLTYHRDIVLIGGGIAGLWLTNVLKKAGYSVALLEKNTLGGQQTVCSQGIIHGGMKYALKGKLTDAAASIADMPALWQACLTGQGPLDLSSVRFLSDRHYLWTRGRFTGAIKSFVSSKTLNSDSHVLNKQERPPFFQHPQFSGSLCALNEIVLDIPNLLHALAQPIQEDILQNPADITFHQEQGQIKSVSWQDAGNTVQLNAQQFIFTAGEGNQQLLANQPQAPSMQTRPLHMVWLKFPAKHSEYNAFFHCVEKGTTPRFTITTHYDQQGRTVWYIGGGIAETGLERSPEAQIHFTQQEFADTMPWLDLTGAQWGSFHIDRAEVAQPGKKRPDSYFAEQHHNLWTIWPTKLTLVPGMAEKIKQRIGEQITPMSTQADAFDKTLPKPKVSTYPWDNPTA